MATELEARPFRDLAFRGHRAWEAAGRHWLSGEVGPVFGEDLISGNTGAARGEVGSAGGAAGNPAGGADGNPARRGHQAVSHRAVMVISGYDKANAAAATTSLIEGHKPDLVLNFGIAGAFQGSGLRLGDVVLASEDSYADTGASSPEGWLPAREFGIPLARVGGQEYWNTFPLSQRMLGPAERILCAVADGFVVAVGLCLTSSLVTGMAEEARALEERWGALAESMEGAACAQICLLHGVPCVEVRAISNMVGDRNRASWDISGAAARVAQAAAALCDSLPELLRGLTPRSA